MSGHTPGPWEFVLRHPSDACAQVVAEHVRDEFEVAVAYAQEDGDAATNQRNANARLISAAPDLLETLKRVLEQVDGYDLKDEPFASARAAVAKAEGTS